MPNPPAHRRVAFSGTLSNGDATVGNEIFTFGIADNSGLALDAIATAYMPVHDFFGNAASLMSSTSTLTAIDVQGISETGKVAGSYHRAVDHVQGLSSGAQPTICSQAITLETSTDNGRGHHIRGRFYPPGFGALLGNTTDQIVATNLSKAWATVIKSIITNGGVPCVASTTAGGVLAPVTGITVDNVIDTIRGRKNALRPFRSAVASVS